jgi:hypothetical protein
VTAAKRGEDNFRIADHPPGTMASAGGPEETLSWGKTVLSGLRLQRCCGV